MAAAPCKYFQFGHCRFGEFCKHRHVKEVCNNENCEIVNCTLRHPKECRYIREYHRCKFGDFCNYSHIEKAES